MTKPNDYVIELFKKIRQDISKISQKLFTAKAEASHSSNEQAQYSIDTVQINDNPHEEAGHSNSVVRARLNLPKTICVQAETTESPKTWYRDRNFLLEVCAITVGAVVAIIYLCQLRAMNQTVSITRQVSERDERAWLRVLLIGTPKVEVDKPIEVFVRVENIGKTPAKHIMGLYDIDVLPKSVSPDLDYDKVKARTRAFRGILFPQDSQDNIGPLSRVRYKSGNSGEVEVAPLTPEEHASLIAGGAYVAIHGIVGYEDAFHTQHWTKFCMTHFMAVGFYATAECSEYGNTIDDNDEP